MTPTPEGRASNAPAIERAEGPRAFICGLEGLTLTPREAAFLAQAQPCGLIIFSRNYADDAQLSALIEAALAALGGAERLVLVDQEGGRVQRLRGGGWPDVPAAARFGDLYARDRASAIDAVRVVMQGLGGRLRGVGINGDCAPCLDVPAAGADTVIGDRAYGGCAEVVEALGRAAAEGLMAAGVLPVIKHIPGHGRAEVDSHMALPVVKAGREALSQQDFRPFRALAEMPAAMSAHVTFEAYDSARPASVSPAVMEGVIRRDIGFGGLVMSDDISMGALAGSIGARAEGVLAAGSDVVLHCNGNLDEMQQVAEACALMSGRALARYEQCLRVATRPVQAVDNGRFEAALTLAGGRLGTGGGDV